MQNYNEFKISLENKEKNNKILQNIISEIPVEKLTEQETTQIVKTLLSIKDKTDKDIECLYSKFNSINIEEIHLPKYIISNNKKLEFNLSPNQIMKIVENFDLSTQNIYGLTIPMQILSNNKEQNLNLSPNQIMSILEKNRFFNTRSKWTYSTSICFDAQ